MTEEEWFGATDPVFMLPTAEQTASPRKRRLFMAGVSRTGWAHYGMPAVHKVLDCAERYADGEIREEAVTEHRARSTAGWFWGIPVEPLLCPMGQEIAAVRTFLTALQSSVWAEKVTRADLLREVVGNPFQSAELDPNWLTSTVILIAQQMYDAREFGAMPILADALQDAGCDHADILDHCRDTNQVHVRGCRVVDLVLGKS